MRCEEVQSLHGPYLDSELEARSTLEIEQHLKSCPDCARLFAEEAEAGGAAEGWPDAGVKIAGVVGTD